MMYAQRFIAAGALVGALVFSMAVSAIDVQEVKTRDGITAYLAQDDSNPIIAFSFEFRGGSSIDPADKLGLSAMAAGLLDEGAGDLDSFAFQSTLQDKAIRLSFSANTDSFSGSVTTIKANADEAFRLMALALSAPRFDEEPVERIRRQILVSLARSAENPGRIARDTMFAEIFPDHPYGRPSNGTPETIQSITADDLASYTAQRFAKDRLIVGVAGDITPRQLRRRLDEVFVHLPDAIDTEWRVPDTAVTYVGTVVVDKAVPQSTVYMAQPGLARTDPDWYTALVADYILGGGSFASRLMDEVREKRGLAYGVNTSLVPYESAPFMIASVGTRNESVAESIAVIRDEWRKFQADGPTADELEGAKLYITGSWPLRFTSSGRIASTLVAVQRDDLGLDFLDRRNDYIDSITLEDVRRVAGSLYKPDELSVIVVGQPVGVENSGG
ncbi:MAG: insulinase family protein [Rhodospirillaceae bacterium]|jgi:zinc protease|nr:insulinase family protein [Rhodospirillaceae bacterium]MBT5241054.1 insulinase family protein [Rhodospirillaceae bacterium]MBT5564670.1 insulinase family protein [Rhodospirillaceae bacterium]MBT6091005.1 insulinase family protein [Rhodospirillaceae bacterium]MBT6961214.1 insulinase family protein [Rhodospirillaceae bacterium]